MPINPNRLSTFCTAYDKHLASVREKYPAEYPWPAANLPVVCARMKAAFERGDYNKDGRAIKAACKELNIPYTYIGINNYLAGG